MRIWLIRCVAADQPGFAFRGEAQLLEPVRGLCDGVLAAIDLDEPNFDAAEEMQTMLAGCGPTWIESSRSGNAHVWAFFAEPIEAWIARGVLREITAAIGKPAVEVFPKQDRLLAGMVGNYINLPYHGDARPILCPCGPLPVDPTHHYKVEDFLTDALDRLNDPAKWRKRAEWLGIAPPEQRERAAELGTGKELHKCAEWIIANRDETPIAEGHRNVVFFNLAKMLTHYEGFDHEDALKMLELVRDSSEAAGFDRVDDREIHRILTNAERGGFTSTGCDDPLMADYVHPDCPIAKG